MSFAWPIALVSLLVVPALLVSYWLLLRRRRKQAVRYSSVALLRTVLPRRSRWTRHVPVALLLLGLVALATAAARPHMMRDVAYARTSVILAFDVSGSMCSNDIEPNRLAVAQAAAKRFVEQQPKDVRMGLVVFSGFAELTVPPTEDRDTLLAAIDGLTVGRRTAIGAAILKGLDAIAEVNPSVPPVGDVLELEPAPPPAVRPGTGGFVPDIVVLLTDGRNTTGIEPLDAVPYAVERRVRVYPIGFGTENPAERGCTRAQLGGTAFDRFGGGGFGGGGFGGFRAFAVADHETLKEVATRTGATYHAAKDADQLNEVFSDLPNEVATQRERREVTWMLAALGALLAAGAVGASMRWSPYP